MTTGACCALRKLGGRDGPARVRAAAGPCHDQAPARIHVPACRSFTGTDRPHHRADGEGPRRATRLAGFWIEEFPVTNARFRTFTTATGYVTEAERIGWAPVFAAHSGGAGFDWRAVPGACWSAPEGPGSGVADRLDHPVVQVSFADANAFADWAGARLPTEAEWEHAARGGLPDPRFPWGDDEPSDDRIFCNIWQGRFPYENTLHDGWGATNPGGAYPANASGLYDMVGNVWEWNADPFRIQSVSAAAKRRNAAAAAAGERLLKGGSFLCHRTYCYRYRIAARMGLDGQSCANNVGFRLAHDQPLPRPPDERTGAAQG